MPRLIDADALEEVFRSRCAQCSNDYGSIAGAICGCLRLVQVQPTITVAPNLPLTLEQLRVMDGMPVWVEFEPDMTGEQLTMWALVEATDTIMLTNNLRGQSELLDDMTVEGWRVNVYRRRPPEERRATWLRNKQKIPAQTNMAGTTSPWKES